MFYRYADDSTIPKDLRNTIAVFGRASGVPIVTACQSNTDDGSSTLPNCYVEMTTTGNETTASCGVPNACAGENGCCGRPTVFPVPDFTCEYGLRCSNGVLQPQPNSRALCNSEKCGCTTRYHTSSTCTTLVGTDCDFNMEQCHIECSSEEQFYAVDDLDLVSSSTLLHQNWQFGPSTGGDWYRVSSFLGNDGTWTSSVQGVGYGQLVWTVRAPSTNAELTSAGELNVEVHLLPISGDEPGIPELALVTIVPEAACTGDGCGIYESTVKMRLNSEWFYAHTDTAGQLFTDEFLTSLSSNEWCVGVNTATNNIEVGKCDGEDNFLTEWFYDSITTRIHLANHPYMCPTLVVLSNSTTLPYNVSRIRDGDLTIAYENTGGNLVWLPCAPCNIGAERVFLDTYTSTSTQFLQVVDGQLLGGDSTNSTLTTIADEGVWAVAHPQAGGDWFGFIMAANYSCGTLDTTTLAFSWAPCDPDLMLARTPTLCTTNPEDFTVGIFQYICTHGFGGTVVGFTTTCSDLGNGNLDGAHGFGGGYGARIDNTGAVLSGGIGYMSDEEITPTGAACSVVVTTQKVLIQPINDSFNAATTGVEVINVTTYTGFFSQAYETQVFAQRLHIRNVLTVINVVILTLCLAVTILLVVLIFYEDELERTLLEA